MDKGKREVPRPHTGITWEAKTCFFGAGLGLLLRKSLLAVLRSLYHLA